MLIKKCIQVVSMAIRTSESTSTFYEAFRLLNHCDLQIPFRALHGAARDHHGQND